MFDLSFLDDKWTIYGLFLDGARAKKAVILQRQKKVMKKVGLIASLGILLLYFWKNRKSTTDDSGDSLNYFDNFDINVHNNAIPERVSFIPTILIKSINKTKKKCDCNGLLRIANNSGRDLYVFSIETSYSLFGKKILYNTNFVDLPVLYSSLGYLFVRSNYTRKFNFVNFYGGSNWGDCKLSKDELNKIADAMDQYANGDEQARDFAKTSVSITWGYNKDDKVKGLEKRWTIQNLDSIVEKWTEQE